MVEETPAHAPAMREAGTGTLDCSPGFDDKNLLTVSYANSCKDNERKNVHHNHKASID